MEQIKGFAYGTIDDDRLFIDRTAVEEIAENIQTPFVLYSFGKFRQNVLDYKDALNQFRPVETHLSYSVKANYNPHLLKILRSFNTMLTTVSEAEIQLAFSSGFPASSIIYNGNGKTRESIELAVKNSVLINVDSQFDLEEILFNARRLKSVAKILIRVNPLLSDENVHAYNTTASKTCKFGTIIDDLENLYRIIENDQEKSIEVVGFHCHLGSTISNSQILVDCLETMLKLLDKKRFPKLKYLNIGGGLNIDYKLNAERTKNSSDRLRIPSVNEYFQSAAEIVRTMDKSVELIVEPGRSLIANSAVLLTRVLGQKQTGSIRQLVVDASMTECIRPALYQAYHHIDTIRKSSDDERIAFDVVGPVCESGDFLGKQRFLPSNLKRDDLLAIFDVGAYCSSMSSNYNMRPRPAEYCLDENGQVRLLRRRETFEDLMRNFE